MKSARHCINSMLTYGFRGVKILVRTSLLKSEGGPSCICYNEKIYRKFSSKPHASMSPPSNKPYKFWSVSKKSHTAISPTGRAKIKSLTTAKLTVPCRSEQQNIHCGIISVTCWGMPQKLHSGNQWSMHLMVGQIAQHFQRGIVHGTYRLLPKWFRLQACKFKFNLGDITSNPLETSRNLFCIVPNQIY